MTGIEITRNPNDVADGKPIFLNMGAHHARKWPSAEHAMEFAYDLLGNYERYERTTRLVDQTRTTAGSLGFTFEIGPDEFHPPFQTGVVAEYLGLEPAAGAGKGGKREAYYAMLEATADARLHSRIAGRAPDGAKLRISKSFQTATSPVSSAPTSARRSCSATT